MPATAKTAYPCRSVIERVEFSNDDYCAFIGRCTVDRITCVVKLADIANNMDLRRLGREPTAADAKGIRKYERTRAALWAASA